MPTTKTAEVLLRYKIDASSANRVSDSFEDLIAEITDLNSELARLGRASATGVGGITRELPKAESGIVALQDEVIRLRKELISLDNVDVTPTVTVEQVGASRAGGVGGLDTIDRLGTVGSQIGSGLGSGEVGNVAGLFGDIAGAASTMNPALIAGTIAIGAISIATLKLTQAYNDAREAADEYLTRQTEINLLLAQGDIEGLTARRDQLLTDIAARVVTSENLRQLIGRFDELDRTINGIGFYRTFEEIQAAQAEQIKLLDQIGELTGSEITSIGAVRDALASFDDETESVKVNLTLVETALTGVVNKMVEFGDKGALALEKLQKELDKFGSLGTGSIIGSGLQDAAAAQKAALDAEAASARSAQALKLKNSVNETTKAQAALITAQDAYNEALATARQKITDLNDKLQTDIAAAGEERRTALLEAERDAGEQRVKIAEDNAKELSRIQRRFDRSYAAAVADRDTLAAARAETQQKDELEQLDERYKDQNKALDDNLKNQQRIIEQRYDAQVRTARSAAEAAIRLEQQRAQAEINLKAQAVQAAINALVSAQNAENSIRASFYNQAINDGVAWANQMRFLTAYGFTIPGGTTTTKQPGTFPGKAGGGPVGAGMPYVVGERGPEVFVPNVNGTIMPNRGGAMFTVNFEGATGGTIRATSKAQAIAVLDKVLTGMGAA